jgi:hypothetical protein
MRKHTIGAALGLLLGLAGLLTIAPTPASAATPTSVPIPPNCRPGFLCMWDGPQYTGGFRQIPATTRSLHGLLFDSRVPVEAHITSYVNRTSHHMCLFRFGPGSSHICDNAGGRRENLALDHWDVRIPPNDTSSPNNNTRYVAFG